MSVFSAQPKDFCRVHALPMWWWPTGGEWACQVATCDETKPVYIERTAPTLRMRETWLAGQRLSAGMQYASSFSINNPRTTFRVTDTA